MERTIWQYSERILTGHAITIIGTLSTTAGLLSTNFLAVLLGAGAIALGAHRLGHAHGMRDMHRIDNNIEGRLVDFEIHAEDNNHDH